MKKLTKLLAVFLICAFVAVPAFIDPAFAAVGAKGATSLTGGGTGALDAYDGSGLDDGDVAFVNTAGKLYVYILDEDSADTESSPRVISPDSNAGDKRWILQRMVSNDVAAYYVDASESNQGAAGGGYSLKDIIDAVGTSKSATIVFSHSGSGNTTTYTVGTNETVPSNFRLVIEEGALLSPSVGVTLTLDSPEQIEAGNRQQIKTGSGTLVFTNGGTVYPEWWGIDGTSDEVQIQYAQDSLPSDGGIVSLASDTTYSIAAPNSMLAPNTEYYGIELASNVVWRGGGYGTVLQLAANQTAGGNDPHIMAGNTELSYIKFENIRFDLNGANNDISGNTNVTAILISGNSAVPKHIRIKDCWFHDNPGTTFVTMGRSNSTGATLGEDIVIEGCYFYNGATDSDVTDHSSVYTWANGVRIVNNTFEMPSTNNQRVYAAAWEFHGSNCIATGNTVKNYAKGCYLASNYVSDAKSMVIDGNTFENITYRGVLVYVIDSSDTNGLDDLVISNNVFLLKNDVAGGVNPGALLIDARHATTTVDRVSFNNNIVRTVTGTTNETRAISINSYGTVGRIQIHDNIFENLCRGVIFGTANGEIKDCSIVGNRFQNFTEQNSQIPIGVYQVGSNSVGYLYIANNEFFDYAGTADFDYGIFIDGVITKLELSNNIYSGLQTMGYEEGGSAAVTERIINGAWEYYVAAAATGGTDTFVVTITNNQDATYLAMIADVFGNFGANEGVYKQFALYGELRVNTMYDGDAAEVITIGDALKSAITAGNPAAVGSNNQITVTFTNTDDTAFTGILRLRAMGHVLSDTQPRRQNEVLSITVANNQ